MPKWWSKKENQLLNDLTLARGEISQLKADRATEIKRYDAALQAEIGRGDDHQSSLKEIDRLISKEAETLQPFRPGFSQTVLQIRHSEAGQGPRSPKLVSALLEEFRNDWNTSVFLDALHSDLVEWANKYYGQARGQVYHEIGARIQNFRRGKSNDVQNLREQIAGWKNGYGEALEETRKQQAIGDGLKSEMRKLKEAHEQSITHLIGNYELQKNIHVGEVAKIKRDHENDFALLNGKIASLEGEHEEATARARRDYDEEKDRLDETINELRNKLDQHKEKLQNTVKNLQASHASELQHQAEDHEIKEEEMVGKLGETKRNHKLAMQRLKEEHGLLLQKEMGIHSSTITTMKQDHEEERSKWQRDLANEKENRTVEKRQLTSEYNQQRTLIEQDYANKTRLNREASDKEVADMREALELQKALFTGRVEKIKEGYKSQLGKLITERDGLEGKHATEFRELRGSFEHEIEAYCEALLARDKFTPIPDPEITSRFVSLTQEVHALSLLEWKADRKKWSTQMLHQLSDNERSLKQQILKDIIWRALHEYIFCSPFRILGEEGKVLEKQWNDACGQGLLHAFIVRAIASFRSPLIATDPRFDNGFYTWPEPRMEAERWRYVNIKECHTALRMRIASELDYRAKLKKSFKFSLENLRESMWEKMGEVVEYKKESVQAMEQMTIKAVNMWLEFGEQRCRILAIENRLNGAVVDGRVNKEVDLLVRPQLKRYGKSNGQDLDIEEIIKGCEGENISLNDKEAEDKHA